MERCTPDTLSKKERLCGKRGIERLLARGKHGSAGKIRYIHLSPNGETCSRILISVPKKLFKRAVKRNLLKRRIRESWRRLKSGLQTVSGTDILVIYSTKEIMTYQEIYTCIETIINRINSKMQEQSESETDETVA